MHWEDPEGSGGEGGGRGDRDGEHPHVNPWLTHVNVWQNPLQYCKVISLQLIKKKKFLKKRIVVKKPGESKKTSVCLPNYHFLSKILNRCQCMHLYVCVRAC